MKKARKIVGLVVELIMYISMILQMGYVLIGNVIHEWLGIAFFVCLVIHIVIKRRWFKSLLKWKNKKPARIFADVLIILLMITTILLMLSSIDVSRTIFPSIRFLGSAYIHRLLATLALTMALVHGGMHAYFNSKKKKTVVIILLVLAIASFSFGQWGVPYINRHFKEVVVEDDNVNTSAKIEWKGNKPLVVYFTRVGNTNFEANVDVVSGASLLLSNNEMVGNTQYMAKALKNLIDCDVEAITVTGEKYPSSYDDTIRVASTEMKSDEPREIQPIDVSGYDSIILVYPIWWYTIPKPVETFLKNNDFSGKTIYLLATQGSSGFASSTEDIKKLVGNANVVELESIYCEDIPKSAEIIESALKKL